MRDELTNTERRWHKRGLFRRRSHPWRLLGWLIAACTVVTVLIVAIGEMHPRPRSVGLEDWEQAMLLSSLEHIATMMNVEQLEASPVLTRGTVVAPSVSTEPDERESSESALVDQT